MEKRKYKKINSSCGYHGNRYEFNLLVYYMAKAYKAQEDFTFSTGNEDKLKLDDIVLETDNYEIFGQAKHLAGKKENISKNQVFSKSGTFSLCVYLEAYRTYFQQLLTEIAKFVDSISTTCQNNGEMEHIQSILRVVKNFEEGNDTYENKITDLINKLQFFNDENCIKPLRSFKNTVLQLITNISPNKNLSKFIRKDFDPKCLKYFQMDEKYFNFYTDNSVNELSKLVAMPKGFVELFLKNFFLVVVPDDVLSNNINVLLNEICKNLEITCQMFYDFLFEMIEKWRTDKEGLYLTRREVDAAFIAHYISRMFINELKTYAEFIEFDISSMLNKMENNLLTIVNTSRYYLIMAMLQKIFEKQKIEQTLFLNPLLNKSSKQLVITSFLHEKYTHLICVSTQNDKEFLQLLEELIEKVESNVKLKKYKKIVLFCESGADVVEMFSVESVEDDGWYEKRKLNMKRTPQSLSDMERHYIDRILEINDLDITEDDFIEDVIGDTENDFFVISDSPGMGKTSLMMSLSVKINTEKNHIAILIHLNHFTKLLESCSETNTVPQLSDFIKYQNTFQEQLHNVPKIICLFVDGFDEISPDYAAMVTSFLKNSRSSSNIATVVVTTRGHLKEELENKFKVKAFKLQPLFDYQVYRIITNVIQQDSYHIENCFTSSPKAVQDFFRIPLHARIFAETIEELDPNMISANFKMDLYELYERLIRKKERIFIREKSNCQGNLWLKREMTKKFQDFLKICTLRALEISFKKDFLGRLGISETLSIPDDELCIGGILELNDASLSFVHKTFQEYFVAKWTLKVIFDINENNFRYMELIFQKVFFGFVQKDNNIGLFIENYLNNNWSSITEGIFQSFGNFTCEFFKSRQEFFKYINYNIYPYTIQLIIKKCDDFEITDSIFKALLRRSDAFVHTDLILLILSKGVDTTCRNEHGDSILHLAAMKGNLDLVEYLVNKEIFYIDVENDQNLTALHWAVFYNHIEVLELLIRKGADITKRLRARNEETNVLSLAASQGYYELFKHIFHKYRNELSDTLSQSNLLHSAVFAGNIDLVKFLLSESIYDENDKTSEGENILHLAVKGRKLNMVKFCVGLNEEFLYETTSNGKSALDIADSYYIDKNIIKFLLLKFVEFEKPNISSISNALFIARKREYFDLFESIFKKYREKNRFQNRI